MWRPQGDSNPCCRRERTANPSVRVQWRRRYPIEEKITRPSLSALVCLCASAYIGHRLDGAVAAVHAGNEGGAKEWRGRFAMLGSKRERLGKSCERAASPITCINEGRLCWPAYGPLLRLLPRGKRMPAERTAMRRVREVLRLKTAGVSGNEIARRLNVAPSTVRLTLAAAGGRGARLAAAGRDDRHSAGGAAFHCGRQQAGASPPCRARLGGASPRAEAQARHLADPVGRVHRALPGRVSLFALLRAVPQLGVAAVGDDAADPQRRRQAVCRLRRRYGAGRSSIGSTARRDRRRSLSPSSAPRTSLMPRRDGRRRSATGSAPTRGPLPRSAACPSCWCRIMFPGT